MLGPESPIVFIVLVVGFAALTYVLVRPGIIMLKVGAGVASFALAAVFGMACVNVYFDYYQTWTDLYNDLSGKPIGTYTLPKESGKKVTISDTTDRAKNGLLVNADLTGTESGIDRTGLVYLPPQYFQAAYATAKFPVIELFHGSPGQPSDWITGVHITTTYQKLLAHHDARPTILVMPSVNVAWNSPSSQCLNAPDGGLQTDTYLSVDVPNDITSTFRADPIGKKWGVGGFSEGGFCAANLALRHPQTFHLAAVMSGYFEPLPENGQDLFRGNPQLLLANDPLWLAGQLKKGAAVPAFWLLAGASDRGDVVSAKEFQTVMNRVQKVPLVLVPHARHTFSTWGPGTDKMLTWATDRL